MLESIVTSKARVKLILKFFLNPHVKAYLREISSEFGGSTNAVRVELNRLVAAKLLKIKKDGRNKYYSANTDHPLYPEINSISRKMTGLNLIYEWLSHIGNLKAAYITGDYAHGIDSGIIDLLLVGELETGRIYKIISKTEELINRRIRPLILTQKEFTRMNGRLQKAEMLLLWGNSSVIDSSINPPHRDESKSDGKTKAKQSGENSIFRSDCKQSQGEESGAKQIDHFHVGRSIGGESDYYGEK